MLKSEREQLLAFLFDRNDKSVENIKFFRGNAENLTIEDMCRTTREVVDEMWAQEGAWVDAPPASIAI